MKNLLTILLVIVATNFTWSQEPYAVVPKNYNLDIKIDYAEEKLHGQCEVTLTNESQQPVDSISFLLYRLMKVTGVTDEKGQPVMYSQNVKGFDDFERLQVNQIYVYKSLQPGEIINLKILYSGYLLGYSETGMSYIKDQIIPKFTLIRFDAYAYPYPCLLNFNVLRLSAARKFDYSLAVSVPDSLIAINGGLNAGFNVQEKIATYRYKSKQPAWRIDIAIADYIPTKGKWIDVYYLSKKESAQRLMEWGDSCIAMYQKWWGDLKSYNGLTIIETEEGSGGQTDETTILLPSESFNKDNGYEFLYHELSHLWNVPIHEPSGLSPRWEEGFATFCQTLAAEKQGNKSAGYTKERTNKYIKRYGEIVSKSEILKTTPLADYGNKDLTDYSYMQPMILFSVMYHWLGDETFNKLMGGFYQEHYKNGASTKTFTDYCIKQGKQKQLKTFFNDWIYTTKYTEYLQPNITVDDLVAKYK